MALCIVVKDKSDINRVECHIAKRALESSTNRILRDFRTVIFTKDRDAKNKCASFLRKSLMKSISSTLIDDTGYNVSNDIISDGWYIEPIDGIQNFINSIPVFCSVASLFVSSEPVLVVIYFPILNEIAICEKGKGIFSVMFSDYGLQKVCKDCTDLHFTDLKSDIYSVYSVASGRMSHFMLNLSPVMVKIATLLMIESKGTIEPYQSHYIGGSHGAIDMFKKNLKNVV